MTRRELLAMGATAFAADRVNRAPFSHENLKVKLPEAAPVKLSNGVTAEIQAVAQKYLRADRAQIVVVGDAARIRGVLEKLGKVEG